VPGGEQQLAGGDVLAYRAHVVPARRLCLDRRDTVLDVYPLAHHDRVAIGGERVTGVDDVEAPRSEANQTTRCRAGGVRSAHRDPVHGGGRKRRRGPQRPDRLGCDAPERLGDRHAHRGKARGTAGPLERLEPRVDGSLGGHAV